MAPEKRKESLEESIARKSPSLNPDSTVSLSDEKARPTRTDLAIEFVVRLIHNNSETAGLATIDLMLEFSFSPHEFRKLLLLFNKFHLSLCLTHHSN